MPVLVQWHDSTARSLVITVRSTLLLRAQVACLLLNADLVIMCVLFSQVLLRRKDNSETFDREWNDYKAGFGKLAGEFWAGTQINRIRI